MWGKHEEADVNANVDVLSIHLEYENNSKYFQLEQKIDFVFK